MKHTTLQKESGRKCVKTVYLNKFQLTGYEPFYSHQYLSRKDAEQALSAMNFRDNMTVTTVCVTVVTRS